MDSDARLLQKRGDDLAGAFFLEPELRMRMQIATQRRQKGELVGVLGRGGHKGNPWDLCIKAEGHGSSVDLISSAKALWI